MKIGIIGATGGIAAKAYLPVYASLQSEHDFILYSRKLEEAEKIRKKYGFPKATHLLANLDNVDMVFIHAATSVHYKLAKYFLDKKIPVVMDKPISENIQETRELLELAKSKKLIFLIAFNRRFAPAVQELKDLANKTFVKVTKNVLANDKPVKFNLYDMFIHPLDTLIYLLDDEIIKIDSQLVTEDDRLKRALVFVQTKTTTGLASMNLEAGAFQEEFTVEAKSASKRLTDLTEKIKFENFETQKGHTNGWLSATYLRGFDDLIKTAIASVEGKEVDLRQENILQSHEIIEEMLVKLEGEVINGTDKN
ncbi:MAG: Gfo/Idh/MocA family protein [Lactovum sp.]